MCMVPSAIKEVVNKLRYMSGVNEKAAAYFNEELKRYKVIHKYVLDRVSDKCVDKFRIGFVSGKGIEEFVSKGVVSKQDLLSVGLIQEKGVPYFFNRILIPIYNFGLYTGFSARTVDGSSPKYINTKSNMLYDKSRTLFGLQYARKFIYEKKYAIIVEGYFDFLTLFSLGVKNVVALGGTAFTDKHAAILLRYANHAVVVLDGDGAGREATKRVKIKLAAAGVSSAVYKLPDKTDPDEYVTRVGVNEFYKEIEI